MGNTSFLSVFLIYFHYGTASLLLMLISDHTAIWSISWTLFQKPESKPPDADEEASWQSGNLDYLKLNTALNLLPYLSLFASV